MNKVQGNSFQSIKVNILLIFLKKKIWQKMMTETFKKYVGSLEFCRKSMQYRESSENLRTSSTGVDIRKVLLCQEWNMYTSIHPEDISNLPVRHFFFPAPTLLY